MTDITKMSDSDLEQALGYKSGADISKVSDADLMKAVQPADVNPEMQDAQWGAVHPYLRAGQNTLSQSLVNPVVQGVNAVTPVINGINKAIGPPSNSGINLNIPQIPAPDMSKAPLAARVEGNIAGGVVQGGVATALGGGNPLAGYGVESGLAAYGKGENPLPAAATGALFGIPQYLGGMVGSSLATVAAKPLGGLASRLAPRIGTSIGMGATGAGQAAITGGNPIEAGATGATFGALSPMGGQKILTPEQHDAMLDKGASLYRTILGISKPTINKVEIQSGNDVNDSLRLAAKDALPIGAAKNDKGEMTIDSRPALDQIKATTAPLYDEQNKILASNPNKQFNLQNIADQAKANIDNPNHPAFEKSATDAADAKAKIQNEVDAEILRHGTKQADGTLSPNVDGQTLNMIKQGLWEKPFNPLATNANDGARALGFSAKEAIENAYPNESIKENNAKIGDYLQLQKILEQSHGKVVKGGKLGNQVAGGVGGLAGVAAGHIIPIPVIGEAVGGAVGYHVGESVNKYMNDPVRLTSDWANKINNVKVNNPNPINIRRPGVVTPEVMNTPPMAKPQDSISMNPVAGRIGYDRVAAYGRQRMEQEKPGLVTPVSRPSGMPINQPVNPGALGLPNFGEPIRPIRNPQGEAISTNAIPLRGASQAATNPINIPAKTQASNGPLQPNRRAQFDMSKGGTPQGISKPIATPPPGSQERAQMFPHEGFNPLKAVQQAVGSESNKSNSEKGSADMRPLSALGGAAILGAASVFHPINSQAMTVKDPDRLKLNANQYIMKNEGWKPNMYLDTNGHKTVGYGFKEGGMAWKYIPDDVKQGRRALTKQEANGIFNKSYPDAVQSAHKFAGDSWDNLSVNQQKALIDMSYQMGSLKFPNLKLALENGNYNTAAREIMNSKYAKHDAPQRALQNAILIQQ